MVDGGFYNNLIEVGFISDGAESLTRHRARPHRTALYIQVKIYNGPLIAIS